MNPPRMKKPLRQLLEEFPQARARPTRGGHWVISTPRGPVFVSATPSDWRVVRKVRAELRRRFAP
ncbi:hypothetical protein GALL_245060 [mine drainage metagenome]|uniref:Type II toxin-antitoxin system HicA family toxin n=1 Tax=mine drainage metagenome TaxID=410659 RepID=A0A1J5RDX1_9ZZZZ